MEEAVLSSDPFGKLPSSSIVSGIDSVLKGEIGGFSPGEEFFTIFSTSKRECH